MLKQIKELNLFDLSSNSKTAQNVRILGHKQYLGKFIWYTNMVQNSRKFWKSSTEGELHEKSLKLLSISSNVAAYFGKLYKTMKCLKIQYKYSEQNLKIRNPKSTIIS